MHHLVDRFGRLSETHAGAVGASASRSAPCKPIFAGRDCRVGRSMGGYPFARTLRLLRQPLESVWAVGPRRENQQDPSGGGNEFGHDRGLVYLEPPGLFQRGFAGPQAREIGATVSAETFDPSHASPSGRRLGQRPRAALNSGGCDEPRRRDSDPRARRTQGTGGTSCPQSDALALRPRSAL